MTKKKIAIALSDWLLDEVDDYAHRNELSRSAVIQEATARYVHARRSDEESAHYREEAAAAVADMRAFAHERARTEAEDSPSSLDLLRELRGDAGAGRC